MGTGQGKPHARPPIAVRLKTVSVGVAHRSQALSLGLADACRCGTILAVFPEA